MTTINFKKFDIEAYKPGKSSIKRLKKVVKLSANESALGMSPKVRKIISNKKLNFSRYPDGKSKLLRSQISKKFRCDPNKIICGAGSDEVIQMLCQLFLNSKDEVIVPQFSFLMYRIYAKIVGAKVIFAKEKKLKVSISEILKKVPKSTFIILNAAPALTPNKDFFERIDLLVVNQLEAKMLLNEEPSIFNNLDALRKLQNLGPKEVIITLGAEGYTGISKNGEIFSEPGIKVDVLSTHGAGDSFVGTLAAFICKGEPINIAAQYAQASSALHVKTPIDQREKILQADIENMFSLNQ